MNQNKRYLFYISKTYSLNIITPLVNYLNQTNHTYRFYISNKVKKQFPNHWNKEFVCNDLESTIMFNPDFVFVPGNFVDYRIPGVKVQLFHGLGVEKEAHFAIRHFFDIYLTSGPFVTNRFNQLRKKHHDYFDVIETGWPKVDYILSFKSIQLKQVFQIPKSSNVILYAPTFSSKMESASDLIDYIPQMINENEFWFLKFHELMPDKIIEQYKLILPQNAYIIPKKADITPYLIDSDIMISDTSSVIYEFMILNKPVITYKTIAREDKGINITNHNELRSAIDKLTANPGILAEHIKKHINEINPYLDGKIAERIINSLEKIDPNLYPKPKKPKNFFRKAKLIYHSIVKKGYLK